MKIGQGFIHTKQELNVDRGTLPWSLACSWACSRPPDKEEEACLLHADRGTLPAWTCILADASRLPLEEDKVEAYTLLPASRGLPPSLPPSLQPLCVHCSPSNPCSSISPPVTMTTVTRALLVLGASIRQVKALTHLLQVIALLQLIAFTRLLPIQPQLLNGAPVEMATVGCISYFCESASGFFTWSRDGDTACQRQRICEW